MNTLTQIVNYIKDMNTQQWFDILMAIWIVIIFKLFSSLFSYLILKIFNIHKKKAEIKQIGFYKPLKNFFVILGVYLAILILGLPETTMVLITKVFKICIILTVASGFSNMANPDSKTFAFLQDRVDFINSKRLAKFVSKILKIIIYLIAGFMVITELGYNLNGLAAGLGIGTAVIALAAQDIAKNLIAGASIIFDRQFMVGDWIQACGYQGIVEDITIRSTRILTFDNTEVTIPNNNLVTSAVVNYSRTSKRKIKLSLSLNKDMQYEDLERILNRIKLVLSEQKYVIKDSVGVICDDIQTSGVNVLAYLNVEAQTFGEYTAIRGQINKAILELFYKERIDLAYPGQEIVVQMQD